MKSFALFKNKYIAPTFISNLTYFLIAILWGASFSFQNTLLQLVDPLNLTFFTFLLCSIVLLIIAVVKRINIFYKWRHGLVIGFYLFLMEIFQTFGQALSTPSNSAFITNIGMILVPIVGFIFFSHKLKIRNILILALAVLGMYYLTGGIEGFVFGDAILFLSAIAMALYFIYSEKYEGERLSSAFTISLQAFSITSFLTLMLMLMINYPIYVANNAVYMLVWQAVVFTLVPYILIQWASKNMNDMSIATYDGIVEPLSGGFIAWFIFKFPYTSTNIFGALIMLLAFTLFVVLEYRNKLYKK